LAFAFLMYYLVRLVKCTGYIVHLRVCAETADNRPWWTIH